MLGNLWKYECRSIALDKLDSRGQEFKTIFEETRNKLIRDPDEVFSDEETFAEFCENKDDSNNNGLNKLDKTKACRVICFYIGTKNVLKTTRFTKFVIQKIEMTFKKNIYKLFLEAKLEDKESLFTEKNVMKMREKIKNEIQKLAEYFLCKGGKWINICKAISVTEESSKNDGFRISDHSANDSDDSDAAQRREMERNLRELESDENRQIERIDEIWQSMISAEAELPYGYFDAIAATTEFSMVEELEFENVLMFHNDDDFVMEGANMKPVKKALMNISAAVGKSNIFNHIYLYKPDIIKYLEEGETWQTLKNLGLSPFIWAVNLTPAPEKEIVGDLVDIWKLEQPLDKAGNIDWMDEEDWEEYVLKCECVP